MTALLSKEDKISILESRIRGLEYKKYSIEIDITSENARMVPDNETISKFGEVLSEINNQLSVLKQELTSVENSEE